MKRKYNKSELVDKLVDYVNRYLKIRKLGGSEDEYLRTELRLQKLFHSLEPGKTKK